MTVISIVEAARIAGVSRQAIHALKKAHTKLQRNYPFFCQDHKTKKTGVDIDHPDWKLYITRNEYNPCKKNRLKGSLKNPPQGQADKSTVETFIELLRIMERALFEVMDPTRAELRKVKKLCMDFYQEGKQNE